jgi:hypothetical protein
MGGSNVGRFDLGLTGVRNPLQNFIEDRVMDALQVPVKAGDHAAAKNRFENVRELLQQLNPQQAGELLDHLNQKHPKDPVAKEIQYRFSASSVEDLKKNLELISGRWADKHLRPKDHLLKRPNNIREQLKSDTAAAGKTKRSNLDEIWNAHTNAEKIHSALTSKHGVDENAISQIICGLNKKEKQDLKRAYKEKYGEDLVDAIKDNFNGAIMGALGVAIVAALK